LAKIARVLHEQINTAYPANVCLIGTVLPNGFAQITPRGSTMVFDDEHIALWERGQGNDDGESHGRDAGHDLHAQAGVARDWHSAERRHPAALRTGEDPQIRSGFMKRSGTRLIEAEKKSDPEKKGYAVLVTIERAEDLSGQPLT
jgi:hypothetical protein